MQRQTKWFAIPLFLERDHKVREKCITEESDLTLEKAINFARTYELSKAQLKSMEGEDKSINMLNKQGSRSNLTSGKKYGKQYTPKRGSPQNNKGQSLKFTNNCKNCGGQHERKNALHLGKQCNGCRKYNHFASLCLSSNKSTKKMHTLDICSESDDELFVATIDDSEMNTDNWTETINVNDVPVNFQLDTDEKCNVLSLHELKTICSQSIITKQVSPLRSYSGHIIDTVGVINLRKRLVQQYGDLFIDLGCLPGTHKIHKNKTVAPVVHAPRMIPMAIKDEVEAEPDRMEEIGVILKQQEPTQWVNSMETVIKPNGKIRICVDPRDLNKAILREHYPLKTVEVISQMPNAKVFSKLDATSGFWHIQLDEPWSKLCTFNTLFGRYRFARLPFGIDSTSKVFKKIVSKMVSNIEGVRNDNRRNSHLGIRPKRT
ncbi:unnamed protein product [Mytilus coruscus]|uniref:Reverse transcriptase domain-containing protein n=1 Tax=Mytilus coruscus TaxID=42192 RepID=A0A6J8AFE7_MYTCO|nr:unnamed protein product [Mytilus coruscus]